MTKLSVLLLTIACLISFFWGRQYYFDKSKAETSGRRGLKPLGTLFGVAVLIGYIPPLWKESALILEIALVLFLFSFGMFWWSIHSLSHLKPAIAFSVVKPSSLIRSGPYRWVRHPIYLSYFIFWLGGFVANPGFHTFGAIVVMSSLYLQAARGEEKSFSSTVLAMDYTEYSLKVGMFFPKIHLGKFS